LVSLIAQEILVLLINVCLMCKNEISIWNLDIGAGMPVPFMDHSEKHWIPTPVLVTKIRKLPTLSSGSSDRTLKV
jgi:hypothetical protein